MSQRTPNKESFPGKKAGFRISLNQSMINTFAELSGDHNKLHTSEAHAMKLGYPSSVTHGMLLASFVSRLVGEHLPGGNVLLLSIKIDFHKSTHPGDILLVHGEIITESLATRTLEVQFKISHRRGIAAKGIALIQQIKKPK